MTKQAQQEKAVEQLEEEIVRRIDELSFIISGLEAYEPFLRIVDSWKRTVKGIDDNWHLVADPVKLQELRITKMASMELINHVEYLRADRDKLMMELAKLQHPDDIVNKNYDPN